MKTKYSVWQTAGAAAILLISLVAFSAAAAAAPPHAGRAQPPDIATLAEKAEAEGFVRVIVGLGLARGEYVPEGMLSLEQTDAQRSGIAASGAALMAGLEGYDAEVYASWESVPYMALKVDAAALVNLAANPSVTSIQEDEPESLTLASSTAHIGADDTWAAGYGGQGQTVVILDSGIDANHPFYGGRVVTEACWSNAGGSGGGNTLCPNGTNSQTGAGSADALTAQCMNMGFSICDHGPHVAGIAAGRDPGGLSPTGYSGVAPSANIIAIQVFTRFNNDADCNGPGSAPCVKTFPSDQISGLDYINTTLRNSYSISSANMSLGGGEYTGACDTDSRKAIIDTLRSNGIATVITSGNNGWTNRLGAPGCISTAVTVGAVTDPADAVIYNMNGVVDLLAPGFGIMSSVPDDAYASKNGTSMAAPHVTGAFAVLKAIDPSMSVSDIETLLEDTGVLVTDGRPPNPAGDLSGLTKPRIQLDAAVAQLTSADLRLFKDCKPDDPMLVGESGTCTITVENLGPESAMAVEVVDQYLSSGTFSFGAISSTVGTCVSTSNPQNQHGTVTCDIGGLAAGSTVTIEVAVTATSPQNINDRAAVTSTTPDPDPSNNVAEDELNFTEPVDLEVFKECKPDPGTPLYAGETGICTIRVRNWGPSAASAVQLTDVHDAGDGDEFSFGAVTPSQGSCTVPGNPQNTSGTIDCSLGSLAAGAEASVTVEVTTDEGMDINDTATASSAEADPNIDNNSATDGLAFVAASDLALTKTATPDPMVVAGTQLTYDLTVANNGPSEAVNVVIKDVLPAGVTIQSVTASAGTCNAGVPGDASLPTTCTFDSLADGASETMQIVVLVNPWVLGVLGNNAEVSSDTYDPDNSNNLATTDTDVESEADLSVTKTDSPDPVLAGEELTYDLTVANAGPSTAVDVTLTDVLPAEVSYQSYTVSNGTGTCVLMPPNTVECDLNDLGPGQFVTVVIDVLVDPSVPNGIVIVDEASVLSATPDPNLDNNTDTEETTVLAEADLALEKDANFLTNNPSKRIVYTLTITNNGPSDAQTVVLVDTLPLDPKKIVYVMDSGNGACVYDENAHTVTCDFGAMKPGDVATVDIIVDARGSVRRITNVADVTSSTTDPDPSNNHAEKEIRVKGGPGPNK